MKVLVTGGAGYIGSHTVVELIASGNQVVIVDNLSNSKETVLDRLRAITGQDIPFFRVDLCDSPKLDEIFSSNKFDAVFHFAGLKAVGESVADPLKYYSVNLESTLSLCKVMSKYGVNNLVFSSSATVYGEPEELPLSEDNRAGEGIANPYGRTKYMIEEILKDLSASNAKWRIVSLRYFNPIGAHESGLIGEDPNGTPNNILPVIQMVATGKLQQLQIFGGDYDTPDGTGVRDYIHVTDLARGHVAALKKMSSKDGGGYRVYNLGTGVGTSVLELVRAFEAASGRKINYKIGQRRAGDLAVCYASSKKAEKELGWSAQKNIDDACVDAWRWVNSSG